MDRVMCMMPFTGFSTSSDLVDTLRAVKTAARLMCPATAALLNPTAAGIRHGWPVLCQELPAYFALEELVSFEAQ